MTGRWGHLLVLSLILGLHPLIQAEDDRCGGPFVEVWADDDSQNVSIGSLAAFGSPPNSTTPLALFAPQQADACQPLGKVPAGPVAVLVSRGNCTFLDKAMTAQKAGAMAMLMYDNQPGCIGMGYDNSSRAIASNVTITCISLTQANGQALLSRLQALPPDAGPLYLHLSLLKLSPLDLGSVLLLLMAVGTTIGGALWAGADHAEQKAVAAGRRTAVSRHVPSKEEVVDITTRQAVLFIVVSSGLLLLLFFLINKVFFYTLLVLFCIAATQALTLLGAALGAHLLPQYREASVSVPCLGRCPAIMTACCPLALALVVVWAVCRRASWAWVLQDLLGIALMLLVLRTLRLTSLRVACVLLPLAFFYDVFWVFISPYLFGGTSVMVEVASGGGVHEALPMLLRVPRFDHPELQDYSMLGFGDIILPGLLVAYARRLDIDLQLSGLQGYFVPCAAGYVIGLLTTYAALLFSWFGDQGQPALLYLVPGTLGTVLLLAGWRGHLPSLLASNKASHKVARSSDQGDEGDAEEQALLMDGSTSGPASSMSTGRQQQGATGGSNRPGDVEAGSGTG